MKTKQDVEAKHTYCLIALPSLPVSKAIVALSLWCSIGGGGGGKGPFLNKALRKDRGRNIREHGFLEGES